LTNVLSATEYILLKITKIFLPPIPQGGDLDLNNILHSKYMVT